MRYNKPSIGKWLWQKKFVLPLFLLLQWPIVFFGAFGLLVSVQSSMRIFILLVLFAGIEIILLRLIFKNNGLLLIGGLMLGSSFGLDQLQLNQQHKADEQFLTNCTRSKLGCMCNNVQIVLPAKEAVICKNPQ